MDPILLAIIFIAFGLAIFLWLIYQQLHRFIRDNQQLDEEKTTNLINQVFGEITTKVIAQTKGVLEADKELILKDNEHKRQVIEKLVSDLKIEIDERQKEIRSLETDRNKKFGEITTAIKEHRQITEELKTSTQALSKVLSNNQARGQWGERIIEDILRSAGLIENIHFAKQITLGNSNVKPDITLLLPNGRKVCVDVKFPYSEVQKMAESENKATKEIHLKNFSRDVKTKISEIESRGYINVAHGTLDYAIMFVPNEMLFSFINQELPDVVDEAMTKKIMIVSPFTFLIVARTVREAYANFMMEQNIRKIVNHIHEFVDEWSKFKTEFDKFDDVLTRLRSQYDKLTTTRYKQMDLRLRRIEADQKGEKLLVGEKKLLKE